MQDAIGASQAGYAAEIAHVVRVRGRAMSDTTLVNLGWLGTSLPLLVLELPFKVLLKEQLHLSAEAVAGFLVLANVPLYTKPIAGILSDAVPLFGTRRRSYLLVGLLLGALFYVLLALVPRSYSSLVMAYVGVSAFVTLTGTVLGGMMVAVGKRDRSTGRLSSQRVAILRAVGILSGPLAGWLATRSFLYTAVICASCYVALFPLYWFSLREPRDVPGEGRTLQEVRRQAKMLVRSRTLWIAAGLVALVIVSPGFDTALLYHQTDHFAFSKQFIGILDMIKAVFAVLGATIYGVACSRMKLRGFLKWSIVLHATSTIGYIAYRSPVSAVVLTAVESVTMTIAVLPLYDLAARAAPQGSEALGYSVMMSIWNLTKGLSDFLGSSLYSRFGLSFDQLVWVNVGTTAMVLLAVPFLPAALADHRDGDALALGSDR